MGVARRVARRGEVMRGRECFGADRRATAGRRKRRGVRRGCRARFPSSVLVVPCSASTAHRDAPLRGRAAGSRAVMSRSSTGAEKRRAHDKHRSSLNNLDTERRITATTRQECLPAGSRERASSTELPKPSFCLHGALKRSQHLPPDRTSPLWSTEQGTRVSTGSTLRRLSCTQCDMTGGQQHGEAWRSAESHR